MARGPPLSGRAPRCSALLVAEVDERLDHAGHLWRDEDGVDAVERVDDELVEAGLAAGDLNDPRKPRDGRAVAAGPSSVTLTVSLRGVPLTVTVSAEPSPPPCVALRSMPTVSTAVPVR